MTPHRYPPARRRWAYAAMICALVIGVFGMHTLPSTCATVDHAMTSTTLPTDDHAGAVSHVEEAASSHPDGTIADTATNSVTASGAEGDANGLSVMALCMALVVTAMLLWMALRAVARHRGWRVPRLSVVRSTISGPKCPPPAPTLARLCLLRC